MRDDDGTTLSRRWAALRFSVVGQLLSAPPPRGELANQLRALATREWNDPRTGRPTRFAFSTIERWYYMALNERRDPIGVLRRQVRSDHGRSRSLSATLRRKLLSQYAEHPSWSCQLHVDNLASSVKDDASLGPMPSYASVRRFMKRSGLVRKRRKRFDPSAAEPPPDFQELEVRSYESEYLNALWHSDFHHGSLRVVTTSGVWTKPIAFAALDDRSRLACHVQWYLSETTEAFVHGLSQAFQKRALPRSLMSDNGSAMTAAEVTEGLERLSIVHRTTLPYAPYQNGKQEIFWAQLEGRLMAMLEGRRDLTLRELNVATQAWCEQEYNRKHHSELGATPLDRYLQGPDRGRECPDSDALRLAFGTEVERRQRRSDGTISLEGHRFEIPERYRHLERVLVRYARWDLANVHLICPQSGKLLTRLYPLDKAANSDGRRRRVIPPTQSASPDQPSSDEVAPLMKELLDRQAATGLPPAYVPLDETVQDKEDEDE